LNEKIYKNFFRTKKRKVFSDEDKITNKEFKELLLEVFGDIFSKNKYKIENNYFKIEDNYLANILLNKIIQQENKKNNNDNNKIIILEQISSEIKNIQNKDEEGKNF